MARANQEDICREFRGTRGVRAGLDLFRGEPILYAATPLAGARNGIGLVIKAERGKLRHETLFFGG